MTVDESKGLQKDTRVYWQGDAADSVQPVSRKETSVFRRAVPTPTGATSI